jgi:predicted homoserine dehydrogenase-like protein
MSAKKRIGLVGTGFIARGVSRLILNHHPDLQITGAYTRRRIDTINDYPLPEVLTNSLDQLVENADLIIECSGDVINATEAVTKAFEANLPVVTMDTEFHVTTGSWFVDKGFLTEAEGDQPGCLAALHEECIQMGFEPLVYGNMKGYLNHNPSRKDMEFWSQKQGFSLDQTTSFTDGTKLQFEQAFIANGLGATITQQGMEGPVTDDTTETAKELARFAIEKGQPIADFIVSMGQPPGVFITARHDEIERGPLSNIKMGEGPYYVLMRNYHLCAIEIVKTVRRTLEGGSVLLNNSAKPTVGMLSIAKTALKSGSAIKRGIGGFEVRGEACLLDEAPANHVPIGMLSNAILTRDIEPGEILTYDDVELPPSLALDIAQKLNQ